MRATFVPFRRLAAALAAVAAAWCSGIGALAPARGQTTYSLSGEALFLGNPGTDATKARAARREAHDKRGDWEVAAAAGEYDRHGQRDPLWDADARTGLTQYARYLSDARALDRLSPAPPLREGAKTALARAVAAGCPDGLVVASALALGAAPAEPSPAGLPRLHARAEAALEKSTYPPVQKFRAALRAVRAYARAAAEGTSPSGKLPASLDGTDLPGALDHAGGHLLALLRDPAAPRDVSADAVTDFLRTLETLPSPAAGDRACETLGRVLIAPAFTQAAAGSASLSTAAGVFWTGYAWRGGGDFHAGTLHDDPRWQPFQERLTRAATSLENAWRLDPAGGARAATAMLAVERGQHQSRERLETWFRRALDADPDNFDACLEKLRYLHPRWYGDAAQMIEFGRQCVATRQWVSQLPFVLLEAHCLLAATQSNPALYWRRPDVWNDVRTLYGDCLAANPPTADFERTGFALYACTAGQWKTAAGLFKELGERANPRAMGGTSPVRIRRLAAQAARLATMSPAQADA